MCQENAINLKNKSIAVFSGLEAMAISCFRFEKNLSRSPSNRDSLLLIGEAIRIFASSMNYLERACFFELARKDIPKAINDATRAIQSADDFVKRRGDGPDVL